MHCEKVRVGRSGISLCVLITEELQSQLAHSGCDCFHDA